MKKLLIKNPTILNEGRRFVGSLLIEGDKISRRGEGDVTGAPAFEAAKYQKSYVLFRKLPELYRQFGEMEREIQTLKSKQ